MPVRYGEKRGFWTFKSCIASREYERHVLNVLLFFFYFWKFYFFSFLFLPPFYWLWLFYCSTGKGALGGRSRSRRERNGKIGRNWKEKVKKRLFRTFQWGGAFRSLDLKQEIPLLSKHIPLNYFFFLPTQSSHCLPSSEVDQRGFDFPSFFLSLSGKTKKQECPAGGRIWCKAPTN